MIQLQHMLQPQLALQPWLPCIRRGSSIACHICAHALGSDRSNLHVVGQSNCCNCEHAPEIIIPQHVEKIIDRSAAQLRPLRIAIKHANWLKIDGRHRQVQACRFRKATIVDTYTAAVHVELVCRIRKHPE